MHLSSLEESRNRNNEIKLVTEALCETKVQENEMLRILMQVCNVSRNEAMNALQNEKFMLSPCRELRQYLIVKKGFTPQEAEAFVYKYARTALARNAELSKLSSAKLFEAVKKANN
ncbi:hypothetical protein N780_15455 [Pontibacillus chungwhensis BH030062]|uniref:Uncharacterized protein n=1 Tax=Pontibacillus chungwhensis BH030062 TaxID=1385513 RepID=A0A0A2UVN3_9BACI|nr:hypothetical protein [Pontibacillus chungwhensis]KGP91984.1 hypothetical protein N780_15455 [Pontibacillus chungwhensis BH030062]